MKTARTLMSTLCVMALLGATLLSCQKENLSSGESQNGGKISVTATGVMGEYAPGDESKAELASNIRVKWNEGDKVYAFDGASCLGALDVSLMDGRDYYAVLSGELDMPQSGTEKITLVYSNAFSAEPSMEGGKVTVDMTDQTGKKGSTPEGVPFVACSALDYVSGTPAVDKKIVDFTLATSIMRLNCSGLEANEVISGARLTGVGVECVLNVTETGASVEQGSIGDIRLGFNGLSASSKGAQTIYAAIAKNDTAAEQKLKITQGGTTYEYGFGSKSRGTGKSINSICTMTEAEHEYVEIAGVKWATCNIGASSPEEYGWYFNWAGTTGYVPTEISGESCKWVTAEGSVELSGGFNWVNTPYQTQNTELDHRIKFTKYLGSTSSEYKDPSATDADALKTILDPEDDAARVNWGGTWRMPTSAEFQALCEACGGMDSYMAPSVLPSSNPGKGIYWVSAEQTYIADYTGVAGVLFCDGTSKLFFPAAGCGDEASLIIADSYVYGIYWSSTLSSSYSCYASKMYFCSSDVYPQSDSNRSYGHPVRAVLGESVEPKSLPEGALPGEFSVSPTKKVHFSQGNLICDISGATPEWKFYEHQYDCASSYDSKLISLFTWGHGDWSTVPDTESYLKGYDKTLEIFNSSEDWGTQIGDGNTWRTLTAEEWSYLFNNLPYPGAIRVGLYAYGVKVMNKTNCVILYPDGFTGTKVSNGDTTSYDEESEWAAAQASGVVCLPAAGGRHGFDVGYVGEWGYCWSSSSHGGDDSYCLSFSSFNASGMDFGSRSVAISVRLVADCQ